MEKELLKQKLLSCTDSHVLSKLIWDHWMMIYGSAACKLACDPELIKVVNERSKYLTAPQ
jgi:hypothetical protein